MRISDWSSDVCSSDLEDLKFAGFVPTTNVKLAEVDSASPVDVFKAANRQDVLLHHPYDSFATSVQRFIEQAAADTHNAEERRVWEEGVRTRCTRGSPCQ